MPRMSLWARHRKSRACVPFLARRIRPGARCLYWSRRRWLAEEPNQLEVARVFCGIVCTCFFLSVFTSPVLPTWLVLAILGQPLRHLIATPFILTIFKGRHPCGIDHIDQGPYHCWGGWNCERREAYHGLHRRACLWGPAWGAKVYREDRTNREAKLRTGEGERR